MARNKRYSVSSTEEFICSMCAKGWDGVQLSEGTLGCGDWVLIAPTEKHWNFVIKEEYLNMYSSAQTIRKCRKISAALQKKIDKAMEAME